MKTPIRFTMFLVLVLLTSCRSRKVDTQIAREEAKAIEVEEVSTIAEQDVEIKKQEGIKSFILADESELNLTQADSSKTIEVEDSNGNVFKFRGANVTMKNSSTKTNTSKLSEVEVKQSSEEKTDRLLDRESESNLKIKNKKTESKGVPGWIVAGVIFAVLLGLLIFALEIYLKM